jgi:hypothetical protein
MNSVVDELEACELGTGSALVSMLAPDATLADSDNDDSDQDFLPS